MCQRRCHAGLGTARGSPCGSSENEARRCLSCRRTKPHVVPFGETPGKRLHPRQPRWGPAGAVLASGEGALSREPRGQACRPPPPCVAPIQLGSISTSMLEHACGLEGQGDLSLEGQMAAFVCYYSSFRSVSVVSEGLGAGGRLVPRRKAGKHLRGCLCNPAERWNSLPGAVGVWLTPCSTGAGGGRFGSGLAQRGRDCRKGTGAADSHLRGEKRKASPCLWRGCGSPGPRRCGGGFG